MTLKLNQKLTELLSVEFVVENLSIKFEEMPFPHL
jgi:hypothetical protein